MSATNKNHDALIKRIDEWTSDTIPDDLMELLQDCRAALTKKYVPMTDDELWDFWQHTPGELMELLRKLEAAVIRHAIAQGAKLEVQE